MKDEKKAKCESILSTKLSIAKELNPIVNINILEKLDENNFIGNCILKTQTNNVYMQFSAEWRKSWDEKETTVSLSLQLMYLEYDSFRGGSTSSNGCLSIEDAMLDYLVTWHIRLNENEN